MYRKWEEKERFCFHFLTQETQKTLLLFGAHICFQALKKIALGRKKVWVQERDERNYPIDSTGVGGGDSEVIESACRQSKEQVARGLLKMRVVGRVLVSDK